MLLTQLNHQCLLHLFSFLDRESRHRLSLSCSRLREVFLDPFLWTRLLFSSPSQLRLEDFILGPGLRTLGIRWFSGRVQQVCNVEDWLKNQFQKEVCSKHQGLVQDFLKRVCHTCPNLLHLSLSGCGHISDQDILQVLRCCPRLRRLHLENCVRITDAALQTMETGLGLGLEELRVDFCRNISHRGLQQLRRSRPQLQLQAEMSAAMIPDIQPQARGTRRTLQKLLIYS